MSSTRLSARNCISDNFSAWRINGVSPRRLIVVAPEIALAAVAAAFALFTQVIGAGVLGAVDANLGGRLLTDAALESCGLSHRAFYFEFGDAEAGLGAAAAGRARG